MSDTLPHIWRNLPPAILRVIVWVLKYWDCDLHLGTGFINEMSQSWNGQIGDRILRLSRITGISNAS